MRTPAAEPFLALDATSSTPPYEQIVEQIRTQVAAGTLRPGSPLPSVRQLARDLGVAPNTVARAYGQLEAGGWVTTSSRRGVHVASELPVLTMEERTRELDAAIDRLLITVRQLGVTGQQLHAALDRGLERLSGGT